MKYALIFYWASLAILGFGLSFADPPETGKHPVPFATSGAHHVHLLELFSSESCSSCPPADTWISGFKGNAGLWKDFVPAVFHVDYWNHLGWKDKLSSQEMTRRQEDIASHWPEQNVYTPGFVLDGKEWKDWRHLPNHQLPASKESSLIVLGLIEEKDHRLSVQFSVPKSNRKYRIRIANLGMNLSSQVTSGENSGQTLRHDFVVMEWASKVLPESQTIASFDLKRTPGRPVIAWIEDIGNPTPLQAVGHD